MLKSGIYSIINIRNNKRYIGSAVSTKHRFAQHRYLLRRYKHFNKHLQNAWIKHGEDNFSFIELEFCEKEKLIEREQAYLDWFKTYDRSIGYNLSSLASSRLGLPQSEEMVARMSEAFKGFNHLEETKIKISGTMKLIRSDPEIKLKYSKMMMGNDRGRNYKKWPHRDGSDCRCRSCKDTRNFDNQELLRRKRLTCNMLEKTYPRWICRS